MSKEILKKLHNEDVLTWIVIGLLGILLFFIFFPVSFNNRDKIPTAEIIVLSGCENCMDMNVVVDSLQSQSNFKINKVENLDYKSEKGKSIINKYGIEKIPVMILKSKDIDKINFFSEELISKGKGYLVFNGAAPYLNLNSGETKGIVNFIEIQDNSCVECGDFSSFMKNMENAGVKKGNYEIILSNSNRAKELIEKNNIGFLPSLFISKDIEEYLWITAALKNRIVEKGEYYLVSNPVYPYKNLIDGTVKGKVKATYLINKSCDDCLDPYVLKDAFQNLGVYIKSEEELDVLSTEGKRIIKEYNIELIPTIILSMEISDYNEIKDILKQVGTIENDGVFVFRKIKEINAKYQEIK